MPLSSVLGASSVIKPGVCTSTTRPSVPYTGQLIFETDTSRLAVWTGSAWQYETASAGPPGLVYITGASFTTATSFSLPDNTFSSNYRNYRFVMQITALTTDATFTMRLRASGSDNTTSNYRTSGNGITSAASTISVTGNAQTSFNMAEQDSGIPGYSLVLDIIAPQLATQTMASGRLTYFAQTPNGLVGLGLGLHFEAATQFDSLTFISSAASSITGYYTVYGYTDS